MSIYFLPKVNSLRYKFVLSTIIFAFVFVAIIIYIWDRTAVKDADESATTYMSQLFNISNNNLEIALKDINSIISVLSVNYPDNKEIWEILKKESYPSDQEQYEDNKKITDMLTRLSNNKYYLNGITIFNLKDVNYSSGVTMTLQDMKAQPWFSEILKSHGERIFIPPHFYDLYSSENSVNPYKDKVFSYAKAIIANNAVIGYVIADIKCEILTNIFDMSLSDKGYIFLVDSSSDELIFESASNMNKPFSYNPELAEILKSTTNDKGSFYAKLAGKSVLLVYAKSSFTGWTTIGIIPKEVLLKNFYAARNYVLILTLFISLFAFIVLLIVSSILTQNIVRLNKAVSKISGNNLNLSVNIKSKDEVGQLYHQINAMVGRIKELIENIVRTEKAKSKAEIMFLQSQINPHFLYNTLNTIKFISSLHGVVNIGKITDSLSSLLHVNMDERIFISVREEVEYTKNYLGIQDFKYNHMEYNILVEDDVEELMTLKLLLQPIVENSLIHGISAKSDKGIINIKIYLEDNCLKMRVQDNGIGMDDETIKAIMENKIHSRGIGLSNVIARIKMYFGDAYGVTIVSQKELFTIMEITIPAIKKDEVKNYV